MAALSVLTKSHCSCLLGGAAILTGGIAAYANSFAAPFVFDGNAAIVDNPTIRHLWPLASALRPPGDGSPVSGRPLTNLSFALNYAFNGLSVGGYHALQVAVHLAAGLLLFGILRRTLANAALAGACAFLWTVHPLQSEAVTYVAQRSEELMGLCYLGALYCFIRAEQPGASPGRDPTRPSAALHSVGWLAGSWLVCLLGMAAKEVMATAPVMIFVYDRTFLAGTFREAWRQRRRFYLALSATWLLLAFLAIGAGSRGGTIGFGGAIPWTTYSLMQIRAVAHYLRLCFWPHPLIIDYGPGPGGSPLSLLTDGLLVALLAASTAWALWRRRPEGYLGAWFFVILAPTTSFIPVPTEIIAEHRMYLPLAAVIVLAVLGLNQLLGFKVWAPLVAAGVALVGITIKRNQDYKSPLALWAQTTASVPQNPGAHNNLGAALLADGQVSAAADQFSEALRLDPSLPGAHNNLGRVLIRQGNFEDAVAQFSEAVRLAPAYPEARVGLALAYFGRGNQLVAARKLTDAIAAFRASVQLNPGQAEAQGNLGAALLNAGRPAEALGPCETALQLNPNLVEARVDQGNAWLELGHAPEAILAYRAALKLRDNYAIAHHNLAAALHAVGRDAEARAELAIAARLQPTK